MAAGVVLIMVGLVPAHPVRYAPPQGRVSGPELDGELREIEERVRAAAGRPVRLLIVS